ncbi:hypothetical protein Scep_021935 [Stephania cephalantha]|uniref:Uncharacterized protein n=1 Tax=Stephania cephalantha TaxID=152367 RepID=A0AAP0I1S8_9MAGN
MRATDEAFKKKSEQMSSNRKSEVGGPGTGISLHSAGSISARQHGDTLEKNLQRRPTWKEMFRHLHTHGHDRQSFVDQRSAKIDAELTRRLEEMSTQTPDTSIDEDAVFLEVVPEVKERVYGLGSQGYHRGISSGGASSSRGPAYGLQELEELQWDHQRLQETLLKERMEIQEQMQRDKMERQEETREMQDRLAPTNAASATTDTARVIGFPILFNDQRQKMVFIADGANQRQIWSVADLQQISNNIRLC